MIADEFNEYMRDVEHPPEQMTPAMLRSLKMAFMAGAACGASSTADAGTPLHVLVEVKRYADDQFRAEQSRN